jgi:predicted transcriptional regulator
MRRTRLKEESLKVLKVMNEVTSRTDLNGFARMVGLTPAQTIEQIQELVNAGLVRKSGSGYGITEKGKAAIKAFTPVPEEAKFHFYNGIGQPTGFKAENIQSFYETAKQVGVNSLEFHVYRGDFENWLRGEFQDAELADKLAKVKNAGIKGEVLRKEILKAVEARYGKEELL